jgi:superfamily II DNA or RNA helicase
VVHWYRDVDGQACVRRPVVAAAAEQTGPTEQQQAEKITAEPYGYQEEAIGRLCEILKERKSGIDASDTGAGKTYIGAFVCRRMGLRPVVVCLKSAIGSWKRALMSVGYGEEEIFVNNYEQYVRGNCFEVYDGAGIRRSDDTLVIVDEVHRCKNFRTKNARMLGRIARSDAYLLMLSATAFESPDKAGPIVSALGLCEDSWIGQRRWMAEHGCYATRFSSQLVFCGRKEYLVKMHHGIFPRCGVRLRIGDIPGFPACRYIVDPVTVNESERKKIDQALNNVRSLAEQLGDVCKDATLGKNLAAMQRERQVVEYMKIPVMVEMVDDLVEEGRSVAVFVNFQASMDEFRRIYGDGAVYIHGQQNLGERERAMGMFQSDRIPLIVLNSEAGGSSISLHDINGKRPRHSIISPNWSAVTFKQVLGRIHRSGGRSPAIQRIVLVDGTIEAEIARKLKRKLESIKHINDAVVEDGDLI